MPAAKPKTPREQLGDALEAILPKKWRIVRHQINLDTLSTTVVMLKLSRLQKLAAAPRSAVKTTWTITVISHLDIEAAEDALDVDVPILCLAINQIPGITWIDATKVLFQERYLAFDITAELTANNK